MGKNILITGASGLVGSRLTEILLKKGHKVSHLGRGKTSSTVPQFVWDIDLGIMDPRAIAQAVVIIHLAGAGVAEKRWSQKRKQEIIDSRVKSTELIYNMLKKGSYPVKALISASAIGYYGTADENKIFKEDDRPGKDFLAAVTTQWEETADKITTLGIRVVKLRTGIVLSEKGGALKSMAQPVKAGFGAALGSGDQYLSWIHIDDLCMMYCKALEDVDLEGAYNSVGPEPVTNAQMTKMIAKVLRKPLWLPAVPGFVLKLILGEMAEIVLEGSKVSPDKIIRSGFQYQFPELESALRNLYRV